MTFLGIQQEIFDRTGNAQSPAAAVTRQVKSYLNRWHRRILSAPGMAPLRRVIITQASVANQATYGLVLDSIRWMTETTTQRRLRPKPLGWYRDISPDPSKYTGTPDFYVPLGHSRIHTRPSVAAGVELFVKAAAGDVGTVKAEVIRSTGYRASLSVVLTGATAVTMSSTITDVMDIVDFYVSAAQTGVVILTQVSGSGTELSRIPIGATFQRFLRYALVPRPTAVITYQIDGIADVVDLSNDTDEPLISPDFHDILVDAGVYETWMMGGRASDAKALRAEMELRIRRLRASLVELDEDEHTSESQTFDESIKLPVS